MQNQWYGPLRPEEGLAQMFCVGVSVTLTGICVVHIMLYNTQLWQSTKPGFGDVCGVEVEVNIHSLTSPSLTLTVYTLCHWWPLLLVFGPDRTAPEADPAVERQGGQLPRLRHSPGNRAPLKRDRFRGLVRQALAVRWATRGEFAIPKQIWNSTAVCVSKTAIVSPQPSPALVVIQ